MKEYWCQTLKSLCLCACFSVCLSSCEQKKIAFWPSSQCWQDVYTAMFGCTHFFSRQCVCCKQILRSIRNPWCHYMCCRWICFPVSFKRSFFFHSSSPVLISVLHSSSPKPCRIFHFVSLLRGKSHKCIHQLHMLLSFLSWMDLNCFMAISPCVFCCVCTFLGWLVGLWCGVEWYSNCPPSPPPPPRPLHTHLHTHKNKFLHIFMCAALMPGADSG